MLKAIVSPSFRLLMAVTRLVLPALKSVLSAVLTVMLAARRAATDAATAVTAKRERSFFIKFLRCEGLHQLSVQELAISTNSRFPWQGLSAAHASSRQPLRAALQLVQKCLDERRCFARPERGQRHGQETLERQGANFRRTPGARSRH